MTPVKFNFRAAYKNVSEIWEKSSSHAIILTSLEKKAFEKAYIILSLVNLGYSTSHVLQPDTKIKWEDFLKIIDHHCAAVTGATRKISDKVNFLSPLHLDSIMRLTQYEDGKVTVKRICYFCNVAQDGGVPPPLYQMESTIMRFPNSWNSGLLVGILSSNVAKEYLLGQGFNCGSYLLRMQYNSPCEACISSVQSYPQNGANFVDHLTISKLIASNDEKLMDYLSSSKIHRLSVTPGRNSQNFNNYHPIPGGPEPSPTYRSLDTDARRTNNILQGFQNLNTVINSEPLDSVPIVPTTEPEWNSALSPMNMNISPSANISYSPPTETVETPLVNPKIQSLDPKVLSWLEMLFANRVVLEEVAEKFAEAMVSSSTLHMLDANDLREMDLAIGPRKIIARALENYKSNSI